jgi:hypothetical protein
MKKLLLLLFAGFLIGCSSNSNNESEEVEGKEWVLSEESVMGYDSLTKNYEFIGRWKMVWTITGLKNQKAVEYEFYNSDDKNYWYEVHKENNSLTIHKFIRNGDKYTRKPQSDVDYYLINKDGELKAYDNDGFIGPEFGFKYVKME